MPRSSGSWTDEAPRTHPRRRAGTLRASCPRVPVGRLRGRAGGFAGRSDDGGLEELREFKPRRACNSRINSACWATTSLSAATSWRNSRHPGHCCLRLPTSTWIGCQRVIAERLNAYEICAGRFARRSAASMFAEDESCLRRYQGTQRRTRAMSPSESPCRRYQSKNWTWASEGQGHCVQDRPPAAVTFRLRAGTLLWGPASRLAGPPAFFGSSSPTACFSW